MAFRRLLGQLGGPSGEEEPLDSSCAAGSLTSRRKAQHATALARPGGKLVTNAHRLAAKGGGRPTLLDQFPNVPSAHCALLVLRLACIVSPLPFPAHAPEGEPLFAIGGPFVRRLPSIATTTPLISSVESESRSF